MSAEEFYRWLLDLQTPSPLSDWQMAEIGDPKLKAARAIARKNNAEVRHDTAGSSPGVTPGPDGLEPELLKLPEVEEMATRKRSTIYKLKSEGHFPQRIKIGSSSRWKRTEIEAWLREQIARGRS